MLIHPWDAASSETEWRDWPAGHDFGQLAVNDPGNGAPHVNPTHFALDGDTLLVHLARPNQVWAAIQARLRGVTGRPPGCRPGPSLGRCAGRPPLRTVAVG